MAEVKRNPKVDAYLTKKSAWHNEITALRELILEFDVEEDFKWYQPCYKVNAKNVIIVGPFKDFCVLSFFKGVLLKDPKQLLVQMGENSQSSRVIKITGLEQIETLKSDLKNLIAEAIQNEKEGKKVTLKKTEDYDVPEELTAMFAEYPDLKTAFEKLTPGRQRGYLLHFSAAKQTATRLARIERYIPKIMEGKGYQE
ncbi:YdeI/OmpD-associated family protein [Soonwooa purpurea]